MKVKKILDIRAESLKANALSFTCFLTGMFIIGLAGAGVLSIEFQLMRKTELVVRDYLLLFAAFSGFIVASCGALMVIFLKIHPSTRIRRAI